MFNNDSTTIRDGDQMRLPYALIAGSSESFIGGVGEAETSIYSSQPRFVQGNSKGYSKTWKRITSVSMVGDENWGSKEYVLSQDSALPTTILDSSRPDKVLGFSLYNKHPVACLEDRLS